MTGNLLGAFLHPLHPGINTQNYRSGKLTKGLSQRYKVTSWHNPDLNPVLWIPNSVFFLLYKVGSTPAMNLPFLFEEQLECKLREHRNSFVLFSILTT